MRPWQPGHDFCTLDVVHQLRAPTEAYVQTYGTLPLPWSTVPAVPMAQPHGQHPLSPRVPSGAPLLPLLFPHPPTLIPHPCHPAHQPRLTSVVTIAEGVGLCNGAGLHRRHHNNVVLV